ncbi:MAG: insulinase family protein [Myxococcales bacterium]|nr:insulinase family protein [Myxococcales bacterium]
MHLRPTALLVVLATACGGSRPGAVPVTAPVVAAPTPTSTPPPTTVARPAPPPAPREVRSLEGITEYELANGLRVLLFPDPTQSTVTVNVTYLVGSMHEGAGETGMAHLLEHMMFKGSPHHRNVLKLLDERGAFANGTTWQDRTNYYETLPATGDNLRWTLELEADRMVNASVSADDLATEFSVVRNEMEAGENDPRGILEQRVTAAAYQWHNYGKDTIGSRSDVEHVPVPALRAFYERYYQPDNAVLIIAGKFDPAAALADANATFGVLPRPTRTLPPTYTVEPVQDGERAVTLRRTGDVRVLLALYHAVAGADPDHVAFDALADILTREPTGRLYQALVTPGLASEVWSYQYLFRDPAHLLIGVKPTDAKAVAKARAALVALAEGFAARPVTSAELERWRASAQKEFALSIADSARVAIELSEWLAAGDWRLIFAYRDRLKTITVADVQRVATAYLKPSNRTLGEFVPTAAPDRAPPAPVVDVAAQVARLESTTAVAGEAFVASLDNLAARVQQVELGGGIKASFLPKQTRGGKVHVELVLRHGDATTLQGKAAVARLLGALVERGTTTKSFAQLEELEDRLTADVDVSARAGAIVVSIETVRGSLPEVVALVGDLLKRPALAAKELAVVRQEELAALEEQRQDPAQLAFVRFAQLLAPWPKADPRATLSVDDEVAAVKRVTLKELAAYHRDFWGAGHGEVAAVGDFDPAELGRLLTAELGGWTSKAPYARLPDQLWPRAATSERIDTKDKEMAQITAGTQLSLRDDSPDAAAVMVASQIFGGSTGSRLWMRLRERDGFSYGVWGGIFAGDEDPVGQVVMSAILAPQNLAKARAALVEEVARLRDQGVTDDEVAVARTALREQEDNALADDGNLVGMLRRDRYLGRDLGWRKARRAAIAQVTAADVTRVIQQYLVPDQLVWVEAGDLAKAK